MASPQAFDKMSSRLRVVEVVDGSDRTTAAVIPVSELNVVGTWFDMRDVRSVLVKCILHSRTDNIEAFSIQADADSDGGDGNIAIVEHADPTGANLAGDSVFLECQAEQLAQEGADNSKELRYISAKVKLGNGSDRITMVIIAKMKRRTAGLTADYSA